MEYSSFKCKNFDLEIGCFDNGVLHIKKKKSLDFINSKVILTKVNKSNLTVDGNKISTPQIDVVLDENDTLSFFDKKGDIITKEKSCEFIEITVLEQPQYETTQTFTLTKDEAIYGLGQFHDDKLNYRNHKLRLAQGYLDSTNPMLYSTNGFAIMWDNYSETFFTDDENGMSFNSKVSDTIEYCLITGKNADDIIKKYRDITGKAPLFPKWAFGYQQCFATYETFDEVVEMVRKYREHEVPLDCIVQDWKYWGDINNWSALKFGEKGYENPAKSIQEIHDMNANLLVSIWPSVGCDTEIYKALDEKGYLLPNDAAPCKRTMDATNPNAVDIYYDFVKENMLDLGVDALWMDGTEPEYGTHQYTKDYIANRHCYDGVVSKYLNTYSLSLTDRFYKRYRDDSPEKRMQILTRSSFLGQQRNAAITWSGDVQSTWKSFKTQIINGINFCISGIPYWSHDIGGWIFNHRIYPEFSNDPSFRELYTRWFAFGVFTPICRSHGIRARREIWEFGKKGEVFYDAIAKLIDLRYSLISYLYSMSYQVANDGFTMFRGLFMDFPQDKKALEVNYEYMFGKNMLVRPVTDEMMHANPNFKAIPTENIDITFDSFDADLQKNNNSADIQTAVMAGKENNSEELDYFEMTGTFKITEPGKYFICAENTEYAKMFIEDDVIMDSDVFNPSRGTQLGSYEFEAKEYTFKLLYRPREDCKTELLWKTPSVYAEQATAKELTPSNIYLPAGENWYDFYTNEYYTGGQEIQKTIPLDEIGLYIKAGSIIPICEVLQYTTQKQTPDTDIYVYDGADGSFTLYEDENNNYNYEDGKYSLIEFNYSNDNKELTINARKGEFDGMLQEREFNIIFISNGKTSSKKISYSGNDTLVTF